MRSFIAVAIAGLATLSSAVPAADVIQKKCTIKYQANFEKLAAGPVDVLNPPPVPFHGLHYNGFTVANSGLISTVTTKSPPNAISFSLIDGVLKGAPSLSVDFPGSKALTFDLYELYLGCVLVQPLGVNLATSCTVKATGTKASGKIVTNTLSFKGPAIGLPVLAPPTPLQKVVLRPGFRNLKNVKFEVTSGGVLAATSAVLMDNLRYNVTRAC